MKRSPSKKRVRVAGSVELGPAHTVNWANCIICQCSGATQKTGPLVCPALNSNPATRSAGYRTIAESLDAFKSINALPAYIDLAALDDGSGVAETMLANRAKWHRACFLKFNSTELKRAQKRSLAAAAPQTPLRVLQQEKVTTRSAGSPLSADTLRDAVCFLCGGPATRREKLWQVRTEGRDEELQRLAKQTRDENYRGILCAHSFGDYRAQEAKYHDSCLRSLRNSCREPVAAPDAGGDRVCEGIAFADLAAYIAENLRQTEVRYTFKMKDLTKMYSARLAQLLGVDSESVPLVHTTRLRERVLLQFPELREERVGREFHLVQQRAVGNLLSKVDMDEDAVALRRVVTLIRKEMASVRQEFNGSFTPDCQEKFVPPAVLAVVSSLLYGAGAMNVSRATQPALTLSQLLIFNYQNTMPQSDSIRHFTVREPPLPLYLGLCAYGKWKSQEAVDDLYSLGIGVSSDRLRRFTSSVCQLSVMRAEEEGIFCPLNLKRGLFTIAAYDNVDKNTASNTAADSFHGTALSLFQTPSQLNQGVPRSFTTNFTDVNKQSRRVPDLPVSYGVVNTVVLPNKCPPPPLLETAAETTPVPLDFWRQEAAWLDRVRSSYREPVLVGELDYSWSGFHATHSSSGTITPAENAILPVFEESSASASMLCHGLDVVIRTTEHLNPGQVPVMAGDQPLFALAKIIQWTWPELYGEGKVVILFAGFHIEQGFLRVLGDLLSGSGWAEVLAASGVMSESQATSNLRVTHVKRARYGHEVTLAGLHALLHDAYQQDNEGETMDEWTQKNAAASPTFYFWLLIMNLQTLLFCFVRSFRSRQYELYRDCLSMMLPWFFVVDRHHYARWLSVHLKDLLELPRVAPSIHTQFVLGNFALAKTAAPFSAMAVDQMHEQNNAIIKMGTGGAGLIHDPDKVRKWMIAAPEIERLREEFNMRSKQKSDSRRHHEQYSAFQVRFRENVQKVVEGFQQMGNPFLERSQQLLVIDSRVVMSEDSVRNLKRASEEGVRLATDFMRDRLTAPRQRSIYDPLQKAKVKIFGKPENVQRAETLLLKGLKSDLHLFSTLFIASKSRNLDFDLFFAHENQMFPPALSKDGDLHRGTKSDILGILESLLTDAPPELLLCDGVVYDAAALVHLIKPRRAKTYEDYWALDLKPHIEWDLRKLGAQRADLVFDHYEYPSLKNSTRQSRGTGIRRNVRPGTALPKNWQDFLRNETNKKELYQLIAYTALSDQDLGHVVTNVRDTIISSSGTVTALSGVSCLRQEEADGRIILHVSDMVSAGAKIVKIRTVDSDVVVLAISFYHKLSSSGLQELWVDFGTGKQHRNIPVHLIAEKLGPEKCTALRSFHAFTGCDTVSAFIGKGKRSCWTTWLSMPDATPAFNEIAYPVTSLSSDTVDALSRFVVKLYHGDMDLSVDGNRQYIFTAKGRPLTQLPPTSDALHQHLLRAAYQAGVVWGQADVPDPNVTSPSAWGWCQEAGHWRPLWTTKPPIWEACRELLKCGCRGECSTRQCSCFEAGIPCTLRCTVCQGNTCLNKEYRSDETSEMEAAVEEEDDDVDDPDAMF